MNETTTCKMCGNTRPINAYCTCPYGDALEGWNTAMERSWRLETYVAHLPTALAAVKTHRGEMAKVFSATLAAHEQRGAVCACGWSPTDRHTLIPDQYRDHVAHQLLDKVSDQ